MNKVEAVWLVEPFAFEIFDDKFYVWDDPVWLDGADVVSDYLCAGEFPVKVGLEMYGEIIVCVFVCQRTRQYREPRCQCQFRGLGSFGDL